MKLPIFARDGSTLAEEIEIPEELIQAEPNDHAIWLAVCSEMAHRRQGSSATKSRSQVRGGGRKPWRQKGRGQARAGTIRSPIWVGGGRTFGPVPHSYDIAIPKKVKVLARRSAMTYKLRENKVRLIEDFSLGTPKTKEMAAVLDSLGLAAEKTLFLTAESDIILYKSCRNLPGVFVKKAVTASTRDLMDCSTLLIQRSAVDPFCKGLLHAV
ncbi:MAG: 50S ribosomal protein L4 [bacterium]